MRVLIFEDEKLTAERLIQLISKYDSSIEIIDIIESVADGLEWFGNNSDPDLVFMDIRLTDGSCFEIFNQLNIEVPIIFTTAYDEYAIRAFQVNSIDYLLKPIEFEKLSSALKKHEIQLKKKYQLNPDIYREVYEQIVNKYKKRFLVKIGDQLKHISTDTISYFFYDNGIVNLITKEDKKFLLEDSLEKIESVLNPDEFFRINRKFLVHIDSITKISTYFNSRLLLIISPKPQEETLVSRKRVLAFKKWLDK
jgi:two-component system, LytTR family, response regulator